MIKKSLFTILIFGFILLGITSCKTTENLKATEDINIKPS